MMAAGSVAWRAERAAGGRAEAQPAGGGALRPRRRREGGAVYDGSAHRRSRRPVRPRAPDAPAPASRPRRRWTPSTSSSTTLPRTRCSRALQRLRRAPLRRDQLRARGTGSMRIGRSSPASGERPRGRRALSARPDRRGVRAGRQRLARGGTRPPRTVHRRAPGQRRGARGRPLPRGLRRADAAGQPPSSARRRRSPTTPASGGISSFAPGPSRPTSISRATWPGST